VCRELTKLHEEIRRGEVEALALAYRQGAETRGEFVVVIGPPARSERAEAIDIDGMLKHALATSSLKDAVEAVAAATGQKRRIVYQRALALARGDNNEAK
jgi:16S rRNA (cytidine1402-2'-O)-methyltransferase